MNITCCCEQDAAAYRTALFPIYDSEAPGHNRRPNILLLHLRTAVHSPDLDVFVQLREAGAGVAAVHRHDDDKHATRRGTDDVGGYTRLPNAGTHGNPTKVVPPTTARKTTMITSDTGPKTCEEVKNRLRHMTCVTGLGS